MATERGFFRDAGPVILRLERQASWSRLNATQFRGLALAVAALALGLAAITWGRVHVLTNGYEIMDLRGQRDELLAEHMRLQREIGDMQNLDYVETTARRRLGMVDINPNQVITLHSESEVRHLAESVEALFGGGRPASRPGPQP
jgi:cell division protein FtsB